MHDADIERANSVSSHGSAILYMRNRPFSNTVTQHWTVVIFLHTKYAIGSESLPSADAAVVSNHMLKARAHAMANSSNWRSSYKMARPFEKTSMR